MATVKTNNTMKKVEFRSKVVLEEVVVEEAKTTYDLLGLTEGEVGLLKSLLSYVLPSKIRESLEIEPNVIYALYKVLPGERETGSTVMSWFPSYMVEAGR